MEHPYIGRICPHCHKPIVSGETIVICDSCRMPNHLNCWRTHGHCGTPVCKGKIQQVIQGNAPAAAPAPAAPVAPVAPAAPAPQPAAQPAYRAVPQSAPQNAYRPAPQPIPQPVQPPRFEPVYTSDALTVQKDAGIFTENLSLAKNSATGEVFARCQLRNATGKTISCAMVDIDCQDAWGEKVEGVHGHSYLGMQVANGGIFGQNIPVKMVDNNTRKISVSVKKILFADGTTVEYTDSPKTFPKPLTLGEHLGNFALVGEYVRLSNQSARFVPVKENGFVRCACGHISRDEAAHCPVCGGKIDDLLTLLDAAKLEESHLAFVAAEQERIRKEEEAARIEAERIAEEQRIAKEKADRELREKKKKRRKKALIISTVTLVLLAAIACLTIFLIIPSINYQEGMDALAAKKYDEAYEIFMSLGGFSDSGTQAQEARYQKAMDAYDRKEFDDAREIFASLGNYKDAAAKTNEVLYAKGMNFLEKGEYLNAVDVFRQLGTYQDSADKVNEIRYTWAGILLADKKYDEAYALYIDLGDYSDSAELANKALYSKAYRAMSDKKYDEAYEIFVSLGNYSDSPDMASESLYRKALDAIYEKKYDEAYEIFVSLGDYKDSPTKVQDVRYRQAVALLDQGKFDDARAIFTELGDYLDSANMLKEVTYREAKKMMTSGFYDKAKEMFRGLGNYADSADMIKECDYQRALSYKNSSKYKDAIDLFLSLGSYKDSSKQVGSVIATWVDKALSATSTSQASSLVSTLDVNGSYRTAIYDAIVKHINNHTADTYWFNYGPEQPSKNMYVLIKGMSNSYKDVKNLKAIFKELSNDDNGYADVFRTLDYGTSTSPLAACWGYKFIQNLANSDGGFDHFLEGAWDNWIWDYYIIFEVKSNGSTNCSYSLPKPYKPSNMDHYDIRNKIYAWYDAAGNELTKVFRFEIVDYNTIKVYCYSNGYTYEMERSYK